MCLSQQQVMVFFTMLQMLGSGGTPKLWNGEVRVIDRLPAFLPDKPHPNISRLNHCHVICSVADRNTLPLQPPLVAPGKKQEKYMSTNSAIHAAQSMSPWPRTAEVTGRSQDQPLNVRISGIAQLVKICPRQSRDASENINPKSK